jgi:hypothetical protein
MTQNKPYILIGPGRWGTRDKWIGIPVNWPQISNAKVIVETSFEDFPTRRILGLALFSQCNLNECGLFYCST